MPLFPPLGSFSRSSGKSLVSWLIALSAAFVAPAVAGDAYPNQPIRLVVPFGAGGITDVVARLIGQKLGDELAQTVIIENRPGAGGTIAAQTVARAKPDGYTLLLGTVGTQVVNRMLYSKLNYDPEAFTPVSLVSNSPFVLAVSHELKISNLPDLIDEARKHPGQLNYGSAGTGSSPHLGIELLSHETGIELTHVPFKSGAEAVNAAIGGQVEVVLDAISVIQPQADAGKLRMIALADDKRNNAIAAVPTGKEQGAPGFSVGSWNAIVGPAAMPQDKVQILARAIENVLARQDVRDRLAQLGIEPMSAGVDAYQSHVRAESTKWKKIVDAAGTRLD